MLGTAVVLFFAVFAIGEGVPPLSAMNASFAAIGVTLVGMLLIWRNDLLGGIVSLAGLGWFQAIDIMANGQPSRGAFMLFVIPGVLAIVAGLLRRWPRPVRP